MKTNYFDIIEKLDRMTSELREIDTALPLVSDAHPAPAEVLLDVKAAVFHTLSAALRLREMKIEVLNDLISSLSHD